MNIQLASNIDEVITELQKIIDDCKERQDRLGYFPALYQIVTIKVKEGCDDGFFENPERMRALDVLFANRYLEAYIQYKKGEKPTAVWDICFHATQIYWPTVLQHLMVAMNAHINLDLGIAAGIIAPGDEINSLQGDFNKINIVLNSLIDATENQLAKIWKPFGLINSLLGDKDEKLAAFSMKIARAEAWKVALRAAACEGDALKAYIKERDQQMKWLAAKLVNPGVFPNLLLYPIRLTETGTVSQKIETLFDILPDRTPQELFEAHFRTYHEPMEDFA